MDPTQFLPGGALYRPMPVYLDASTGQEVVADTTRPFAQGCTCAARGTLCFGSPECSCDDTAPVNSDGVCQEKGCFGCNGPDGPSRCHIHPGCECVRNRKGGECFGCNDSCHEKGGQCDNHVRSLLSDIRARPLTVRLVVRLAAPRGSHRDQVDNWERLRCAHISFYQNDANYLNRCVRCQGD